MERNDADFVYEVKYQSKYLGTKNYLERCLVKRRTKELQLAKPETKSYYDIDRAIRRIQRAFRERRSSVTTLSVGLSDMSYD